jgi:hypothetical protein
MKKFVGSVILLSILFLNINFVCAEDTTAPTPNPCKWVITPQLIEESAYYYHFMQVEDSTDASGPISYYFDCIGGHGESSGWISSTSYTAGPFWGATISDYRVRAKDAFGNMTEWSETWRVGQVPEPTTLALLSLGLLAFRKK